MHVSVVSAHITLRAVFKQDIPFVIGDSSSPRGMLIDLFNLVVQDVSSNGYLNTSVVVQYHPVGDNRYGALTNGSWDGMCGEIVNGTADVIASFFAVDTARQAVLAYTTPYFASGYVVLVRADFTAPDVWYFLRPFQTRLWGCVLAMAVLVLALLYSVDRASPFGYKKQYSEDVAVRRQMNLPNTIMAVAMPLFGQSASKAGSWSSRLVYLGFLFFTLISMSLYTANLTAFATVKRLGLGVQNIYDVQRQQTPFCIAKDSAVHLWFQNNPDPRFRAMLGYAVLADLDSQQCELMLRAGAVDAVVTSLQLAQYAVSTPPCELAIAGDPFTQGYNAFAVSAANATLQHALSRSTMHLLEAGTVDRLYRTYIEGDGSCSDDDFDVSSSGLDVTSVYGVFLVSFIFFGAGLAVLAVEVCLSRHANTDSRAMRQCLRCCGQAAEGKSGRTGPDVSDDGSSGNDDTAGTVGGQSSVPLPWKRKGDGFNSQHADRRGRRLAGGDGCDMGLQLQAPGQHTQRVGRRTSGVRARLLSKDGEGEMEGDDGQRADYIPMANRVAGAREPTSAHVLDRDGTGLTRVESSQGPTGDSAFSPVAGPSLPAGSPPAVDGLARHNPLVQG